MTKFKRLSRKYISVRRKQTKKFHGLANHPFVIPVITFLALFIVSITGLIVLGSQSVKPSDSHVVTLNIDGKEQTLPTRADTVKELLNRLNIPIDEHDIVEPKQESQILEDNTYIKVLKAKPVTIIDNDRKISVLSPYQESRNVVEKAGVKLNKEDGVIASIPLQSTNGVVLGQQLVVDRAKLANINLYGNQFSVRSRVATVGELLKDKNIKVITGDTVEPSLESKFTNNMSVFIVRIGKKVVSVEEPIPSQETIIEDPSLAVGATVIRDPGTIGKKLVTYEVELRNNQEVGRTVLQTVLASSPTNRVIVKGTKILLTGGKADWLIAAGIPPSDYAAVDYIISRESGWCPTKWQGEHGNCPAYHGTPTSSGVGYGLCQATPGYKMASAGADWGPNPITQLKWCSGYAAKYGGWQGAYRFWIVNHWW